MENASKALIIAGAILIVLVIISISIVFFNSTKRNVEETTDKTRAELINIFNSEFRIYDGKQNAANVIEILVKVKTFNSTHPQHQIRVNLSKNGITYPNTPTLQKMIDYQKTYNIKMREGQEDSYIEDSIATQKRISS